MHKPRKRIAIPIRILLKNSHSVDEPLRVIDFYTNDNGNNTPDGGSNYRKDRFGQSAGAAIQAQSLPILKTSDVSS
jgi:hypothetical protein